MRRSAWSPGLGLLAAALVTAAVARQAAAGGWWDDLDKGEAVRLADLIADPQAKHDGAVTFPCVYRGPDRVFFPYFTSFTPDKHVNVSVWLDGSPIWEREAYARDEFPFLYLRRDHPQRDELMRLAPFTRIEVTGRIRDVYRSRPWIEILAFRATAATLGKDVVEWVKTGDGYASRGDATRAETYYKLALAEVSLDETYALRIRKRRADVLRSAGRDADAAAAEGGTILGGSPLPPTDATAPPPADAPARREGPAPAGPPGGDTFPTGPLLSGRNPPAVPAAPDGSAKPAEITSDDLPGVPYGTPPPAAPLPGAAKPREAKVPTPPPPPTASRPAPPSAAKPAAAPPTAVKPPAKPADATPPPPPPRVPRLSGVR